MGNYDRYTDKLLSFARDNGIIVEKDSIFAVYDAETDCGRPKMKMFIKTKLGTE